MLNHAGTSPRSGYPSRTQALCLRWGPPLIGMSHFLSQGADFPVSSVSQIVTAVASAQPGDTITMTNQVWQDADILFKKHGAPGNPIALRAQTPGAVILGGSSRLRIAGSWLVVDGLRFQFGAVTNSDVILFREKSSVLATNCVLTNCAIVDYSPRLPPDDSTDYKWISIYGVSNRVEHD